MALDVAQQERDHRREMWEQLRAAGGSKGITHPSFGDLVSTPAAC
jgi:hypothetical protein